MLIVETSVCGQIGQEAEIYLESTCPCNFTLHYEIASRGNIVQSGHRHSNSTAHRGKRATITFDTNTHGTTKPPRDSGQFYYKITIMSSSKC